MWTSSLHQPWGDNNKPKIYSKDHQTAPGSVYTTNCLIPSLRSDSKTRLNWLLQTLLVLCFSECSRGKGTWSCLSTKDCWLDTRTNRLPEAPPVIILAIRCDPHQDLLPRAEWVPQAVQVAVLNVQDGDGSLPSKREHSTEGLNSVFILKTPSFYHVNIALC